MKQVLFICTANICRSPMAEAIFNTLAEDAGLPFRSESAGVAALRGEDMAPHVRAVLGEAGIYPNSHRARQVDKGMLREADLVLTMSYGHIAKLQDSFENFQQEISTLPEHVNDASGQREVPDPYGLTPAAYRACMRQLLGDVELLIQKLRFQTVHETLEEKTFD